MLLRGEHLDVEVTAGPPPSDESVLFAIADEHTTFIVIILIRDGNVILRHHGVADMLRVTPLEVRIPGAITDFRPGAPMRVSAWKEGQRWCLAVGERRACDHITAGSLWRFFMPALSPPNALLDALCLACLFLPIGFYRARAPGVVLAALPMVILPLLPAGIAFSIIPVIGAALGWAGGHMLDVARTRRSLREGTIPA